MVVVLVLKDLAKTTSSMPVVSKVLGIETVQHLHSQKLQSLQHVDLHQHCTGSAQDPLGSQRYHPFVKVTLETWRVVEGPPL